MNDIDAFLSMVENPTRRRILEALVRGPHYPLQLSKELGISQQAVIKNLNLLEKNGMIVSYRESSSIGPTRTVYEPGSEFTLTIDMRNGMFSARMTLPEDGAEEIPEPTENIDLEEVRKTISLLDEKIEELDRERSLMIRRRETIISSTVSRLDGLPYGYGYRALLYEILNEPDRDVEELSFDLHVNANAVKEMIDDIEETMKEKERR